MLPSILPYVLVLDVLIVMSPRQVCCGGLTPFLPLEIWVQPIQA